MSASAARKPVSAPAPTFEREYEDLLDLDDLAPNDEPLEPAPAPYRSKHELLEASRRIREECESLLRRYQEACGARTCRPAPVVRESAPVRRTQDDSAWRRKALMHLLIEELVPCSPRSQ